MKALCFEVWGEIGNGRRNILSARLFHRVKKKMES